MQVLNTNIPHQTIGDKRKMDKKEIKKQLWAIVLPVAVQNLFSSLVSASDALMLGGLTQSALSAVSLATQVTFVLGLFYMAFTIGNTILAAQYWGKGDGKSVEKVLAISLRFSMFISILFWFVSFFFPQFLMRLLTNNQELISLGTPYLRIVAWSYLCTGITQIYLCTMKNTGRTLLSTIYATISLFVNLVCNMILIFGLLGLPKLEIQGAAYATVLARILELYSMR